MTASTVFILCIAGSINANPICDFSVEGDPKWESAAIILADTIVGYIPYVGNWIETFIDLMALTQRKDYSIDLTECVETLIEQELESSKVQQPLFHIGTQP